MPKTRFTRVAFMDQLEPPYSLEDSRNVFSNVVLKRTTERLLFAFFFPLSAPFNSIQEELSHVGKESPAVD